MLSGTQKGCQPGSHPFDIPSETGADVTDIVNKGGGGGRRRDKTHVPGNVHTSRPVMLLLLLPWMRIRIIRASLRRDGVFQKLPFIIGRHQGLVLSAD